MAPTCKSNAKSSGDILDTSLPDVVVESWVDSDVLGAHGLDGKLADLLNALGGTLLEGGVMHTGVQVDSVFTGNNVRQGRALLALFLLAWCHVSVRPAKPQAQFELSLECLFRQGLTSVV